MDVEIITIGDEILIGQTVDTNSAWMAVELNKIGLRVNRVVSISDELDTINEALLESSRRGKVVLMTGGLGPTNDDVTKKAVCQYFDTKLVRHEEVLKAIRSAFKKKGIPLVKSNEEQADLPEAADILINKRGTASGMWFEKDNVVYCMMPGVPYEMKGLMTEEVLPRLNQRFRNNAVLHKTIMTHGMGESSLAASVLDWEQSLQHESISLAYLPDPMTVKLRLSYWGEDLKRGEEALKNKVGEFLGIHNSLVYGYDDQSMSEVVSALFKQAGKSLSVAESCTGGNIARELTSHPGSSEFFYGSAVTYAVQSKVDLLGVPRSVIDEYGVVSEEVARAMAEGARQTYHSDYAVATTGVAGPGDSAGLPAGTLCVSVSSSRRSVEQTFTLGRSRERNIKGFTFLALNLLRKEILFNEFDLIKE